MTTCAKPYCQSERWRGPDGTNDKLTLCEFHQKEDWRRYKAQKSPRKKSVKASKPKTPKPDAPALRRCLLYDPRDGSLQRVEMRMISDLPVRTYNVDDLIALYRALGISTIHVLGDLGLRVDNTQLIEQIGARIAELKARQP